MSNLISSGISSLIDEIPALESEITMDLNTFEPLEKVILTIGLLIGRPYSSAGDT
jgi:hypothetical protein